MKCFSRESTGLKWFAFEKKNTDKFVEALFAKLRLFDMGNYHLLVLFKALHDSLQVQLWSYLLLLL